MGRAYERERFIVFQYKGGVILALREIFLEQMSICLRIDLPRIRVIILGSWIGGLSTSHATFPHSPAPASS
jgi:hypothetical protein